jgi:uncharacterized YccA/Bax inhibitor family protein
MSMLRTANPVLNENTFERFETDERSSTMTIQGTIHKSLLLIAIVLATAFWTYARFLGAGRDFGAIAPFFFGGLIGGLVLALVICFKPTTAVVAAPLYAACKGLSLGGISIVAEMKVGGGIVFQGVALTMGVFVCMLLLYMSRTLRATPKFTAGVMIATGGIAVTYLVSFVVSLVSGSPLPYIHTGGTLGILFSAFCIVIASLNLILDFGMIEEGARRRAPKHVEWYCGFALLVTLVWLYIEILRLLMKLRR